MLRIVFKNTGLLVSGNDFSKRFHRHYFFQIMISPGNPVRTVLPDGKEISGNAIIIESNKIHKCLTEGPCLSLFVNPECREGRFFPPLFIDGESSAISLPLTEELLDQIREYLSSGEDAGSGADSLSRRILFDLFRENTGEREIDPRIKRLIERLPSLTDDRRKAGDLASLVGLSESRLMHLFQENMGISIRRYLQWNRLMEGLALVNRGESLTNAAMEAGFADHAHFTRTFRENFGVNLKSIFRNSRFVQVCIAIS